MVRLRTTAAWLVLAASVALGDGLTPVQYLERRRFADGLYSRKMYPLAEKEYSALLRAAPDGPENDMVEFRLGECLRFQGKLKEAAERFSHLYVKYPESSYQLRAAYRRARLYMETGQLGAAVEHFRAILKEGGVEPSVATACQFYLADSLAELARDAEALEAFQALAVSYPESVFMPYARMREAEVRRRGLEALPESARMAERTRVMGLYQQVLEGTPEGRLPAEALFQMAELHFRARDFRSSAEFYRRLLREYADDQRVPEARLQAAWAASHAGLHADALSIAQEALAGTPGKARVEWLYLAANCQRLLGKLDEAVGAYDEVIKLAVDGRFGVPARYEQALVLMKRRQFDRAVQVAGAIPLTDALRVDVAWLLGECYKELGQTDKAIQHYRIVETEASLEGMASDATYRLAYMLQQQEAWSEASRYYLRLVERFPKNRQAAQALFASAVCQQRAGNVAGAARDWGELAKRYAGHELEEEALYQGAMAHMKVKQESAAIASLDALIGRFGSGVHAADARYWRGMIWKQAGRLNEAAGLLRQAMETGKGEIAGLARYNLALVVREQGKDQAAADLLAPLLESELAARFPAPLSEWLSIHYFSKKQYAPAAAAARQLIRHQDAPAWLQAGWCLLGRAEDAQGQTEAARKAFIEALAQSAPTEYGAEAALRLGDVELSLKAYDAALAHYRKAVALAASERTLGIRARAFFGTGRAAAAAGNHSEAARGYMMVAILFDDPELVPEALHGAMVAFAESGQLAEAKEAAEELIERYPDSSWAGKAREKLSAWTAADAAARGQKAEGGSSDG